MSDFKPSGATPDYRNPPEGSAAPLPGWAGGVAGRYALAWEQVELDRLVADVFGYHALQLGLPQLEGLRANRMPCRWLLTDRELPHTPVPSPSAPMVSLHGDFHLLPFPANSLDLVVMPHTLESAPDPHHTLREVERVLRPEGRIVVTGFNPASLWGAWHKLRAGPWSAPPPQAGAVGTVTPVLDDWVGYWRLRDWLRLLSFEVEGGRFGCYIPPTATERWRDRLSWIEPLGDRWWPVLGSVYALVAVKRVRGMRVVGLARRTPRVASAPAVVAQRHPRNLPSRRDVP